MKNINNINGIILCLEKTPGILTGLLAEIPVDLQKVNRKINSWNIHEHACHIASGDKLGFINRFHQFMNEEYPVFIPFSGDSFPPGHLLNMNLDEAMKQFDGDRKESVRLARSADIQFWQKKGNHPEYEIFTPLIMLRHRLMHDYFHMHRIEELWLTREQYL